MKKILLGEIFLGTPSDFEIIEHDGIIRIYQTRYKKTQTLIMNNDTAYLLAKKINELINERNR